MAKKRRYYIEVDGTYSHEFSTPERVVKDMLRYDGGLIIGEVKTWELECFKSQKGFKMVVQCDEYTKARWDSFGLRTKEVVKE